MLFVMCCVAAPRLAAAQDWADVPAGADVSVARGGVVDFSRALEVSRPRVLKPLYISMSALQGLDAMSTWRALAAGGREANPVMAPVVGSPATLVALKAGVAGSMIYATERLWKRN